MALQEGSSSDEDAWEARMGEVLNEYSTSASTVRSGNEDGQASDGILVSPVEAHVSSLAETSRLSVHITSGDFGKAANMEDEAAGQATFEDDASSEDSAYSEDEAREDTHVAHGHAEASADSAASMAEASEGMSISHCAFAADRRTLCETPEENGHRSLSSGQQGDSIQPGNIHGNAEEPVAMPSGALAKPVENAEDPAEPLPNAAAVLGLVTHTVNVMEGFELEGETEGTSGGETELQTHTQEAQIDVLVGGLKESSKSVHCVQQECDTGNKEKLVKGPSAADFQVSLKIKRHGCSDDALELSATRPQQMPVPAHIGTLSKRSLAKLAASPFCERPDSAKVIKQPRFKMVGKTVTPRTFPYLPGLGTGPLRENGFVTPRGVTPDRYGSSSGDGVSSVNSANAVKPLRAGDPEPVAGALNFRPASAPSKYSPSIGAGFPPKPMRPASCHTRGRHKKATQQTPHMPRPLRSAKSVSSTSAVSSSEVHMEGNPYEIVALAMTDKNNNSIPCSRWPYHSTWVSGEPRYEGYCTPVLPADNRYGIKSPLRRDAKPVPSRCGMEFLEQLYATSLQLPRSLSKIDELAAGIENARGSSPRGVSLLRHLQTADELDERVWESEKRGRALLNFVHGERFEFAQLNAIEDLARDNHVVGKSLHRGRHTLYWAGVYEYVCGCLCI